jgi:hypothetical protein
MSKLILSASLLLILEISIAQTANDKTKLIIAPYSICAKGLIEKVSLTTICRRCVFTSTHVGMHVHVLVRRRGPFDSAQDCVRSSRYIYSSQPLK